MNVPSPVNVDPNYNNGTDDTDGTTTATKMKESTTTTTTSGGNSSSQMSSSPDDILDDIATSILLQKKKSSPSSSSDDNNKYKTVVVAVESPSTISANNTQDDATTTTNTKTTIVNETTTTPQRRIIDTDTPSATMTEPKVAADAENADAATSTNDNDSSNVVAMDKGKDKVTVTDNTIGETTIQSNTTTSTSTDIADTKSNDDDVTLQPVAEEKEEVEEDDEVRLAMEMAMAATKNVHLSPHEIQQLMSEKNAQVKMIDEFSKQNEDKIKKHKELHRLRSNVSTSTSGAAVATSWWNVATKKAEEMKDRAERSLYAEQISNDPTIMELRKTMKILKKTFKAHRLQGNRVETRHAFKRQRMEKRLLQSTDRLKKTQAVFTNSSYNVQEYIKAMMRASKKWRKMGTDDELLLEAQLSRNMHQMLALEKQKVQCKKNTKELKKYLQRCKGWLSDKKAFCEMNIMTIDATQNSILRLYEETLRRQDKLIQTYKSSDEFVNVDLNDVDLSHIIIPHVSFTNHPQQPVHSSHNNNNDAQQHQQSLSSFHDSSNAMRGLPIVDSIRKKKGYLDHSYHSEKSQPGGLDCVPNGTTSSNEGTAQEPTAALSRKQLLEEYYRNKQIVEQQESNNNNHTTSPELYVVANKDDESVSSRLSDPDASFNNGDMNNNSRSFAGDGGGDEEEEEEEEESDNDNDDAPWNAAHRQRNNSTDSLPTAIHDIPFTEIVSPDNI